MKKQAKRTKPLEFMKEKGFIKVWKPEDKYRTIKQMWTDGRIMVFENREEFPEIPGCYEFDSKKRLITPHSPCPDFEKAIPKEEGYEEAEPMMLNDFLQLLRLPNDGRRIIAMRLKSKNFETWINLEYFDYLNSLFHSGLSGIWEIRKPTEAVLYLDKENKKEIIGVIMPIRQEEKRIE